MNTINKTLLGLLFVAFSFAFIASCGNSDGTDVTCGDGTVYDAYTHSCIVDRNDPGFNGVVENARLGGFELTKLSFPDRLIPAYETTEEITITNKTNKKSDPTMIRVSLVKGTEASVKSYLKKVAGVGSICTTTACTKSNILPSCTQTKDSAGIITDPRGSCDDGYYCHPVSNFCFLKLIPVAAFPVNSIAAGQSGTKTYRVALPSTWKDSSPTQLVYTIGEESLAFTQKGETVHDSNVANTLPTAEDAIVRARGYLQVGPTSVIIPTEPDLAILDLKLDNNSFQIDTTNDGNQASILVNARFMAIGKDLTISPAIRFSLTLPGQNEAGCSIDDTLKMNYDPLRMIPLIVDCPTCEHSSYSPLLGCQGDDCRSFTEVHPYTPSCVKTNSCGKAKPVVWKAGQVVDGTFRLILPDFYRKLLADTLDHPSLNPGLTKFNELPGKLTVGIDVMNRLGTPNRKTVSVVFMPPPATKKAQESDPTELADTGLDENDKYASSYPDGLYPEQDKLTPTLYNSFGTDWAGAAYQIKNITSKERLHQAVVKQALLADNYFKLNIFEKDIYLMKVAANVDFGTRRALASNKASGEVITPSMLSGSDLAMALIGFDDKGQLMNTVMSFDFKGDDCDTKDNLEYCMIYGPEEDSAEFGKIEWNTGVELPEADQKFTYQAEWEKIICKGPLCFRGAMELGFTVGIKGTLGFFRDSTKLPEYSTGIEATIGPYVSADGSASGALSCGLATIAIAGDVNFLTAKFTPTLRLGLTQQLKKDVNPACWWQNTGRLSFYAPAEVESLSGRAYIEAYVGSVIDTWFGSIDLRVKVLDFTLVDWPAAWHDSWMIWDEMKDFNGGAGLCPNAPNPNLVWKTPIGCKTLTGADGYCPMSIPISQNGLASMPYSTVGAGYKGGYVGRFYLGASQCGTLIVNGNVDRYNGIPTCRPGDSFNVMFGPIKWARVAGVFYDWSDREGIRLADPNECRWTYLKDKMLETTGGSVYCASGDAAREVNLEKASVYGPFSGTFNDTRISFCTKKDRETYRWIDMFLKTDDSVSQTGLTVKLELQEGAESAIYSDEKWWSTRRHPDDYSATWKLLEGDPDHDFFYRSVTAGALNSAPWYGRPVAPFDTSDASKAKWIWSDYITPSGANTYAYFRRPFLAAKNHYTGQVRCDNDCQVYLDGELVANNSNWAVPTTFEIDTGAMRMHLLAIRALNTEDNGTQAINFMMK